MATVTYSLFLVNDAGYTNSHVINFQGEFDTATTGPAIGPSELVAANVGVVASVIKDPGWFFDISTIPSIIFVEGRVPLHAITDVVPADAIISSVVQTARFGIAASGSPTGAGADGGSVEASAIGGTFSDTYVGSFNDTPTFSFELVTGPPVSRGFLTSTPIRTWQALARFDYGWGNAGLPGGDTGDLGVSCDISVEYAVTYTTPPPADPPVQTALDIASGATGGGTTIELTGTGFVFGATVTFGGTPATSVTFNSSTSLTIVTPAHAAGVVNVEVTNPDAQVCTLPLAFTYIAPPPDVMSCDQVVVELVYDAAILGAPTWPPLPDGGPGGSSIPRGPGECAGVAYGLGFIGSPGGMAGTGDPMSTVSIDLKQFFGGSINTPPALGFLKAYSAGTTTPLDTFANSSLATANAWPIQLDIDGNSPVPIFLGPFIYKFDLQDADGNSLAGFPKDNIAGSVWPGQVLGAVTVNPIANADAIGHGLAATLNKAASGTHALFALLALQAPTIGAGAATLTEAATLHIAGPPLGGTNRYAVHVVQGDILLTDDASKIGFFGETPVTQRLVPTGSTTDQVITALQELGLFKQA